MIRLYGYAMFSEIYIFDDSKTKEIVGLQMRDKHRSYFIRFISYMITRGFTIKEFHRFLGEF